MDRFYEGRIESDCEELETWELVLRPKGNNVIRAKWVLRNKLNEGEVI